MVYTQEERKNPNFRVPRAKRERGKTMDIPVHNDDLMDKSVESKEDTEVFTALEEVVNGDLDFDADDSFDFDVSKIADDNDDDADADAESDETAEEDAPEQEEEAQTPEVADPEPEKQAQTPEQNAYFAELRRQREAAEQQMRLQQQIEIMRQQMPETQIAQILAQEYGVSPQEMLVRLQQAQIEKEAAQRGLTPQQVMWERQQAAQQQQQQQFIQMQQQYLGIQSLMTRLQREGMEVQAKYPTLTPDDLTEAVIYGYEQNAMHLPLEDLVRARHADKLFAADYGAARQQALAQVSGRMQNSIKAPAGRSPKPYNLTDAERFFAKKMGMSEAEYAKWKS